MKLYKREPMNLERVRQASRDNMQRKRGTFNEEYSNKLKARNALIKKTLKEIKEIQDLGDRSVLFEEEVVTIINRLRGKLK